MNKINSLIAASVAASLIGCGDDKHQQQPIIVQAPQPQYIQQDPQYQQQYAQPQYQQPVIQPQVVQHDSGSGVGSFVAGAAAGALAGHLLTKNDHDVSPSPNSGSSYNSTSHDYGSTSRSVLQPQTNVAPTPVQPKKNYMDMDKLSASAKQPIPGVTNAPRPPVSLAKPSALNMSKLGRR